MIITLFDEFLFAHYIWASNDGFGGRDSAFFPTNDARDTSRTISGLQKVV